MFTALGIYLFAVIVLAIIGLVKMGEYAALGEDDFDYKLGKVMFQWCFFPPIVAVKMYVLFVKTAEKHEDEDETER